MARDVTVTRASAEQARGKRGDTWVRRLKLRLQFTGWLQYMMNAVAALPLLLFAVVGRILGIWPILLFWAPLGLAALLLLNAVFDVCTVKLGLRPAEAVPERRDNLDAFDLMRVRRACRSFQSRDLTPEHRAELLKSAGRNGRPDRQLGRSPIRFEYVAARLTVWPVVGAHEFLVAIAPHAYDRAAVIDVGRSLQKVVLHATRMGLATCWIGPGADHTSVIEHLADRFDPATDHIICVCAVGYASRFAPLFVRFQRLSQHRRLPLTSLFFSDPHFREPLPCRAQPFNSYGRCYEVCQWSPSSYNSQTTRCAAVIERVNGEQRLVRFDFCAATESRYYAAVALGIWLANWETGCQAIGKRGHFATLGAGARGVPGAAELPRYDVSWMVDAEAGELA